MSKSLKLWLLPAVPALSSQMVFWYRNGELDMWALAMGLAVAYGLVALVLIPLTLHRRKLHRKSEDSES